MKLPLQKLLTREEFLENHVREVMSKLEILQQGRALLNPLSQCQQRRGTKGKDSVEKEMLWLQKGLN